MPFPNFMIRDVLGSVVAEFAFCLILYAPGYLAGFASDIFGFRRLSFTQRSLWAIAFSFCISPVAAHLIGKQFGLTGVCCFFVLAGAFALPLLLRRGALTAWAKSERWLTAFVAVGWTALVLLLLIDFQVGQKLYYSVVMADQSYRIAFTNAVVHSGIPPANPLYFAGAPASMPYYYFWYVLCGAVVKLAHVSARQAFVASSVWAAFGLTAAVHLFAKNFFRWTRRTTWIATGLLLVTGADILPALGNLVLQSSLNGNTEWWSVDQIDAWPDSILWVPHHVASVLCCLFVFLLLWRLVHAADERRPLLISIFAAMGCASAFGLSVYVAAGFAILMCSWLLYQLAQRDLRATLWLRWLGITALLSAALLAPFLVEVFRSARASSAASGAASKHFLWFSVRPLIDSGLLTSVPVFSHWQQSHPLLLDQCVRLVLLLPGLAMELGVYGAILVVLLVAKRKGQLLRSDNASQAATFLSVAGLVMTMFLSSSVITNNDFGYRAVMLPQFFLLLLAANLLGSWLDERSEWVIDATRFRRRLVAVLLFLGLTGTAYWAFLLRAWLPIEAVSAASGFKQSPEDAFQTREAFRKLGSIAPASAVVAFRDMDLDAERKDMEVMTPTEYFQRMLVMDSARQILNAEPKCATHFGGDPSACDGIKRDTLQLYSLPSPSVEWARDYCYRHKVQYLLLSARDPAWNSPAGWSSSLPVVAAEPRLKIMQCADITTSSR